MKQEWVVEQQKEYASLNQVQLKEKLIFDLEEAVKWVKSDDFHSAFRFAGGAVTAMKRNEEFLFTYSK